MAKVIPQSSLYLTLALIILAVCLSESNIGFVASGIHSSFLEIIVIVLFPLVLLSRHSRTSPLWMFYLFLIFSTLVTFLNGLFDNSVVRALRDSTQFTYVSFIFIGHYFYSRQYIKPKTLIRFACWISALGSSVFIVNNYTIGSSYIHSLQYNWRILIAFAIICLFVKLCGMLRSVKLNSLTILCMLTAMVMFLGQIRTRAFLLMVVIGFVVVLFSFF